MSKQRHPDFCTVPYDYMERPRDWRVSMESLGVPVVPVFSFSELEQSKSPSVDHVHPGCVELIYPLRGALKVLSGATSRMLPIGAILAIQPSCRHHCVDFCKGVRFFSILVRVRHRDAFPGLSPTENGWLRKCLRALPREPFAVGPEFQRMLYHILQLYRGNVSVHLKKLQIRTLLLELLLTLVETVEQGVVKPRLTTRERLDEVINKIRQHPEKDYPIGELAHACAMSECLFHRLFKAATHESPHQFLLHQRLARAFKAIRETSLPLDQIAESWRFCSSDYFAQQFKMFYGVTPAQVRAGKSPLVTP